MNSEGNNVLVAQPATRTSPVRLGREQDAGMALFPPGQLPTYATKADLLTKADLVDGKVPVEQLPECAHPVESVNGKTGVVTLTASDVSAAPASHASDTTIHVTSADKIAWNGKQNAIADLETIRSGAASGATAYQKPNAGIPLADINASAKADNIICANNKGELVAYVPPEGILKADNKGNIEAATAGTDYVAPSSLATVATSGSYNDLSNKPTIPAAQVNADWDASSGVTQILNKPTIPTVPTNVSAFNNDAGYITSYTETDPVFAAQRNMLAYTSGTTLAPGTACYRSAFNADGTFPTIDATGIPTATAYYQFELEMAVPSTVPLAFTGPSGWVWIDGHGLPDPADLSGGETVYISVRLDCTARTFLASVWRVA